MKLSQNNKELQMMMAQAYTLFEKDLIRYARIRLRDEERCNDLVQDTFLKAWKYLLKLEKIDSMKPFLYHILKCLIIDEYRKRKSVSLDNLCEKGFEIGYDESNRMMNKFDEKYAVTLISLLPPAYQKIITMKYIDDLSLAEISSETGLTKNLVAVKTHRGIEKMREFYRQAVVS